jgi:hypothetical protein
MERRFNLIKSDFEKHEKRVLPRFPFCYLTFKPDDNSRIYEIKDISHTGMQLCLKEEEHSFKTEHTLKGHIHWMGSHLDITGIVKWHTPHRVGVEFIKRREVFEKIQNFLNIDNLVKRLKPLHKLNEGLDIPARLKYWLRSDGPVEVFIWQHGNGEIAKSQILFLDTFLEWVDGEGMKTGRILSKRNVDSPLLSEDEWIFQIDSGVDPDKLGRVKQLIQHLSEEFIPEEVQTFLLRQLS